MKFWFAKTFKHISRTLIIAHMTHHFLCDGGGIIMVASNFQRNANDWHTNCNLFTWKLTSLCISRNCYLIFRWFASFWPRMRVVDTVRMPFRMTLKLVAMVRIIHINSKYGNMLFMQHIKVIHKIRTPFFLSLSWTFCRIISWNMRSLTLDTLSNECVKYFFVIFFIRFTTAALEDKFY